MSRTDSRTTFDTDLKADDDKLEHVHRLPVLSEDEIDVRHGPQGYEPQTDDECRLDKAINRKLDFLLLPIAAINFLLCAIDKGAIGNVATTNFAKDVGLSKDAISNSVSLLSVTFVVLQPVGVTAGRWIGVSRWL